MSAQRCPQRVHWWDIDTTVRCVRPVDHDGHHRDGTRWFDDFGQQVDGTVHRYSPLVPGERAGSCSMSALTAEQVRIIRTRTANGSRVADIARDLGLDYQLTYTCARRIHHREQVPA